MENDEELNDIKSFKDLGAMVIKMRRLLADYAVGKQRARGKLGEIIDRCFREITQREQLCASQDRPGLDCPTKVPLLDVELPLWVPLESGIDQSGATLYALNGGGNLTWPQAVIQSRSFDMWELIKTLPAQLQGNKEYKHIAEECSSLAADILSQIDAERKLMSMDENTENNNEMNNSGRDDVNGRRRVLFNMCQGCGDLKPVKAHDDDAGYDLFCRDEKISIWPGDRALILTGLYIAVPVGFEAQIRPRSGNAIKKGITVLNAPGTIDSGYRGEVGVIIINHSNEMVHIKRGDKIAQMVICELPAVELEEAVELGNTIRGAGGFGSTGN